MCIYDLLAHVLNCRLAYMSALRLYSHHALVQVPLRLATYLRSLSQVFIFWVSCSLRQDTDLCFQEGRTLTALQLVPIAKSLGDDNSSNRFQICTVKAELVCLTNYSWMEVHLEYLMRPWHLQLLLTEVSTIPRRRLRLQFARNPRFFEATSGSLLSC